MFDRRAVRVAWAEVLRRLRDRALALPLRVSGELFSLVEAEDELDEGKVRRLLDRAVADVLRALQERPPGLPLDE